MTTDNENARPWAGAGAGQADDLSAIVTQYRPAERSRRSRRWARRRLDDLLGIPERALVEVDYRAMGFTMGYEQRRAAGLAILERERAA
jgi:hypothetical protein